MSVRRNKTATDGARRNSVGGAGIGPETFRFFRELGRNNSKAWMDANRERYKSAVVEPMRGLLAELTPAALKLYPGFDVCGRTGVNFSRINRDIRFAKDKTPYRPQMYLVFPDGGQGGPNASNYGSVRRQKNSGGIPRLRPENGRARNDNVSGKRALGGGMTTLGGAARRARNDNVSGERALGGGMTTLGARGGGKSGPDRGTNGPGGKSRGPGELYVGVNAKLVTAGFRVYFEAKAKAAALGARTAEAPKWCAQQKQRLGRKFESYWYSMEKGSWTKHNGWPVTPEEWKKLKAWVVRKKLAPAATVRQSFAKDVAKIFRAVLPLFKFVG